MHWFDIAAGLVMLLGGVRSYFRSLTQEVMSLIGLMAVFIFAVWGYVHFVPYLEPVIPWPWLRLAASCIVLIAVAVGAYWLWTKMVRRMLHTSVLSGPDRVLGGLFGIVKVGVLIAAFFVVLIQVVPNQVTTVVSGSRLAPPLLQTAHTIATLLPGEVKNGFRRHYSRMRKKVGQYVSQPASATPSAFRSQNPEPSADFSANDERALRQLIKQNSNK